MPGILGTTMIESLIGILIITVILLFLTAVVGWILWGNNQQD